MRERGIAFLLALASLAAFYGLWLRPAPTLDPDADAARPTTAERRGNGYAALFEWLQRSGVDARSFRERYSGLTELNAPPVLRLFAGKYHRQRLSSQRLRRFRHASKRSHIARRKEPI